MYIDPTSSYGIINSRGTTYSNSQNNFMINKNYLMNFILNQLNINMDDLNKDLGFIKNKVRDFKLNSILENEYIL